MAGGKSCKLFEQRKLTVARKHSVTGQVDWSHAKDGGDCSYQEEL